MVVLIRCKYSKFTAKISALVYFKLFKIQLFGLSFVG